MQRRITIIVVLLGCLLPAMPQGQDAGVRIDEIAPDVYVFTYNIHRSLFIVTEAAVLVTDPQSREAARRFREEIHRITVAPIRYLVYSHHHDDHASGGAELGAGVVTIAHANVRAHLAEPGMGDVVPPDLVFTDALAVWLGDLEVRLLYPGPSETDSNIIVHIPARRLAYMVDAVLVRALPWRDMRSGSPDTWIAALERLEQLDFDTLVPGHGDVGTKADVRAFIRYLTVLRDEVATRMRQGQSLEQIQASLDLPQYAQWERYDEHFALNIAGVYRELARR